MSKTTTNRIRKKGNVALYIVGISLLKRYADKNRLIPTGGVKKPNSRFAIKIIPK